MKNPLTPKQTVDKNGKHTTVHVNANNDVPAESRLANVTAPVNTEPPLYRRRPPYGVTLKTFTDFVGNPDEFNNHDITRRLDFIAELLNSKDDDELVPELANEVEMISYIYDDYRFHILPDEILDFNISNPTVANVREAVDIITPKFRPQKGWQGGVEFIREHTAVERVKESIKEGLEAHIGNYDLQQKVLKSIDFRKIVEGHFRSRQFYSLLIDGAAFSRSEMRRPDEGITE